jgi:tRNA wybutosine-synthesizing protein 3
MIGIYIDKKRWRQNKKKALYKLSRDIRKGRVDREIIPLLKAINELDDFYTLSSCYGRVVLMEIENIGDKSAGEFYKAWHSPPPIDELIKEASEYQGDKMLWLLIQSTILHISTHDLNKAIEIRNLALEAGYKYSKILSISHKGIVIEVLGTERLDIPIYIYGKKILNLDYLYFLQNVIYEMFDRIENRKERFINKIINRKI